MSIFDFLSFGQVSYRDVARDMNNYVSNLQSTLANYVMPRSFESVRDYFGRITGDTKKSLLGDYGALIGYKNKLLRGEKEGLFNARDSTLEAMANTFMPKIYQLIPIETDNARAYKK